MSTATDLNGLSVLQETGVLLAASFTCTDTQAYCRWLVLVSLVDKRGCQEHLPRTQEQNEC